MSKRVCLAGIFALVALGLLGAAHQQSSSKSNDTVTVYTPQGYFVKARNSDDKARSYSYTYVVKGYDKSGKEVSSKEETVTNQVLQGREERELFTAPTDQSRQISYWITISSVFNVKKLD